MTINESHLNIVLIGRKEGVDEQMSCRFSEEGKEGVKEVQRKEEKSLIFILIKLLSLKPVNGHDQPFCV